MRGHILNKKLDFSKTEFFFLLNLFPRSPSPFVSNRHPMVIFQGNGMCATKVHIQILPAIHLVAHPL